jgi:ADP-ribosylglycohydrolase
VPTIVDRAISCLAGVAVGDAIGKQTEMLATADVRRWYPDGVRGFEGEPGAIIPRYVGNRKREWRIGETTDDTERTLAVARAILAEGRVRHERVGREMLGCTKCVHPGVRSLWEFQQAADPSRIATEHDGCGAAIRMAPVGIRHPPEPLDVLVEAAREASISTHGGSLAIAAAAATAAAVSMAIDGASAQELLGHAERAAAMAESRWPGAAGPAFAAAIVEVRDTLAALPELRADTVAAACFPDRPLTIVPLALVLVSLVPAADHAILLATNIGGDSDSVASIAGGILGAMDPRTVDEEWYRTVEHVNGHGLEAVAIGLARLRPA